MDNFKKVISLEDFIEMIEQNNYDIKEFKISPLSGKKLKTFNFSLSELKSLLKTNKTLAIKWTRI